MSAVQAVGSYATIPLQLSTLAVSLSALQASTVNTAISSTSASQFVTPPPSPTPPLRPSSSHLAAGTKIGISIGIPLGAIAFIAVLIRIFIQHRRRHFESQRHLGSKVKTSSGWRGYFQNKRELDAEEQRRHEAEDTGAMREVDAEEQAMYEAEGTRIRSELDSGERYELEVPEKKHEMKEG